MYRVIGQMVKIAGGGGGFHFGTYNIQNGRNGRLESALRRMIQENVDVGFFQETKLTEGIYTRFLAGYKVVVTPAPSRHQDGVAIFYQDSPVFAVKVIHQFGANIIVCQLLTGGRRWYIVGFYLELVDMKTIRDMEAAMADKLMGVELTFAEDLNVELWKTGSRVRDEDITAAVETAGLEDMVGHYFFPRRQVWCRYRGTWSMRRQGRVVRSRTDYILGSDCRIFQNLDV